LTQDKNKDDTLFVAKFNYTEEVVITGSLKNPDNLVSDLNTQFGMLKDFKVTETNTFETEEQMELFLEEEVKQTSKEKVLH
jgi:hypothetical protein